jgi:hypothetical protein
MKKKIAVISCVNDNKKYDVMRSSLGSTDVANRYHVNFYPIYDAKSMSDGYNRGINQSYLYSDYIIYVHQDVEFLNSEWIDSAISLIDSGSLNLVGVVGCEKLPDSLVFWEGKCFGKILEDRGGGKSLLNFGYKDNGFAEVDMIDGLIMMTNKPLSWPEISGFHFYDLLMSQKFKKNGMKVGIPNHTGESLCHNIGTRDFDSINYLRARDKAREILQCL